MGEQKHTPGPWAVIGTVIVSVANVPSFVPPVAEANEKREEWQANATLIAAAPQLLDAAKEALAALDRVFPFVMDAKDSLRLAIKKAEG